MRLIVDDQFDEVERVSSLLASYARSLGEAAFRGDERATIVTVQQARLCLVHIIKTLKEGLDVGAR